MRFGKTDVEKQWKKQCKEERWQALIKKRAKWRSWFAWRPVRLNGGPWVWLEFIERMAYARPWYSVSSLKSTTDYPDEYQFEWHYRERRKI